MALEYSLAHMSHYHWSITNIKVGRPRDSGWKAL